MLPSTTNSTQRLYTQDPLIAACKAGNWWRLTTPDHKIAVGKEAPEHGFVFLIEDVAIIDGNVHSLTLHPHPLLSTSSMKMLVEEFLLHFQPEPEGAALRAREMASVMDTLSSFSQKLVTADAAAQTPTIAAPTTQTESLGQLPIALGGAVAPQKATQAQTAITLAAARKEALMQVQADMQATAGLLGRYQKEQVSAMIASVKEETDLAQKTLESLKTLTLFLGERQRITTLKSGASAPATEKLHFFQRMLFLDEEFAIHFLNQDFDWKQLNSLDTLIQSYPDVVTRLLPQPRSVIIARVRRHSKALPQNADYASIFQFITEDEWNKSLVILVRDGENIHMVEADEDTAHAERLFPSQKEIQALYEKGWSEKKPITPQDLAYSESRSAHDKRSLFYKRFLVLFWGLHSRLNLFGPFMPTDANWFDGAVQHQYFQFIHDEENVLAGPQKPLMTVIKEGLKNLGEGARVLVDTQHIDNWSCPDAFEKEFFILTGTPRVQEALVQRQGDNLYVTLQFKRNTYKGTNRKAKVWIRKNSEQRLYRGLLDISTLTYHDIQRFLENRADREHYQQTINLLTCAQKLLKEEEPTEAIFLSMLPKTLSSEEKMVAMRKARAASGWNLTGRGKKQLESMLPLYAQPTTPSTCITKEGAVPLENKTWDTLPFPTPWVLAGNTVLSKAFPLPFWVKGTLDSASCHEALIAPEAYPVMKALMGDHQEHLAELDQACTLARNAIEEIYQRSYNDKSRLVQRTSITLPIGLATQNEPNQRQKVWVLAIESDPYALLTHAGHKEEVIVALRRLYNRPQNAIAALDTLPKWSLVASEMRKGLYHLPEPLALDWGNHLCNGTVLDGEASAADVIENGRRHPLSALRSHYVTMFEMIDQNNMEKRRETVKQWLTTSWIGIERSALHWCSQHLQERGLNVQAIHAL